jgi:hypothetical protein
LFLGFFCVWSRLFADLGFRARRGPGPLSVAVDTADAPSAIKSRAEERLQLALDDGRLRNFTVTVRRPEPGKRGKFLLIVDYTTRTGRQNSLSVPIG